MEILSIGDIIVIENEKYSVVQVFTKSLSGNTYKVKNVRTGVYFVIKEFVDSLIDGERDLVTNRIWYQKSDETLKSKAEILCEKEIAFQRMVLSEDGTNNRYVFPMEIHLDTQKGKYTYAPLLSVYTEKGIVLSEYCSQMQNKRDITEIFMIMKAMCHAVDSLHEKNILHLDLKPDNLYLEKDKDSCIIKILDLGSAQKINEFDHKLFSLSSGTVAFRSPNVGKLGNAYTERQKAKIISKLSFYDDVYSLANILLYLLLGKTFTEINDRNPRKGEHKKEMFENDLVEYGFNTLVWCHSYLKYMFDKLKNKKYTCVIAQNSSDEPYSFYSDICTLSEIAVGEGYYPESIRQNGSAFMERYVLNRGIKINENMIPDIELQV